jgi:hypothetical protein
MPGYVVVTMPWSVVVLPWSVAVMPSSVAVLPWSVAVPPWSVAVLPWSVAVLPWSVAVPPCLSLFCRGLSLLCRRLSPIGLYKGVFFLYLFHFSIVAIASTSIVSFLYQLSPTSNIQFQQPLTGLFILHSWLSFIFLKHSSICSGYILLKVKNIL